MDNPRRRLSLPANNHPHIISINCALGVSVCDAAYCCVTDSPECIILLSKHDGGGEAGSLNMTDYIIPRCLTEQHTEAAILLPHTMADCVIPARGFYKPY